MNLKEELSQVFLPHINQAVARSQATQNQEKLRSRGTQPYN